MPLVGIYALTALGVLLALLAPLEVAFAAVLGAWILVPAGLILPGLLHVFSIDRVILGAFVVRLAWRFGRPGEPAGAAYRVTPLHAVWGALLAVGLFDGVLLAPGSVHDNLDSWIVLLDCAALLVAALAVVRTIGVWRVLRLLCAFLGVAVVIGIVERITGHGWAPYLAEHLPLTDRQTVPAQLLLRGGSVRSQAGAAFALEYGWVMAALLPLLVVVVSHWVTRNRRNHWVLPLALLPVGAAAAVVLSASRSAEVAMAAGLVLLLALCGASRRIMVPAGIAVIVGLALLAADPSLFLHAFQTANPTSVSSRLLRLSVVFQLVTHRPFVGLGYTGFATVLQGLDDAYALVYGQLGVLGLLALLGVLLGGLVMALRALRAPRRSAVRHVGVACALGVAAMAVASAAYDVTGAEQSLWAVVLLSALGMAVAERLPARARPARPAVRAVLPVAGAAAGAAVMALAPIGWARSFSLYLISPQQLAVQSDPNLAWIAGELGSTVCGYLDARPALRGTSLTCIQPQFFENATWPAQVTVQVSGTSADAVTAEARQAFGLFRYYRYPTVVPDGPLQSGRPAWAVTAPVSGAFAGLVLAFLLPPLRRRAPALTTGVRPAFVT